MTTTHATGPMADENIHEDKKETICGVMADCCSGMSEKEKQKFMQEMMPRMMEMMGGKAQGGMPGADMMGMMMKHSMRTFRWFPLIPITLGVVLFLPGYLLSAEAVRVMWLVLASLPILLGLFGFIMMSSMGRH